MTVIKNFQKKRIVTFGDSIVHEAANIIQFLFLDEPGRVRNDEKGRPVLILQIPTIRTDAERKYRIWSSIFMSWVAEMIVTPSVFFR